MKKTLLTLIVLVLAGTLAKAQLPNASFENWRTISLLIPPSQHQVPQGWFGGDSLVHVASLLLGFQPKKTMFKETSSVYEGQAAVRLVTRTQGSVGTLPGALSNAVININPSNPSDFSYKGGTPVSQRIKSVQARVKYAPKGSDKASIVATAVLSGQGAGGLDSVIGTGDTLLPQALSNYTRVGVDIDYTSAATPDKIIVVFLSSGLQGNTPVDSSVLWVDSVTMSLFPVNVSSAAGHAKSVRCLPNPASNKLFVENVLNQPATIHIYNVEGKLALSKEVAAKAEIDIADLPTGAYYYKVMCKGEMIEQEKLIIAR